MSVCKYVATPGQCYYKTLLSCNYFSSWVRYHVLSLHYACIWSSGIILIPQATSVPNFVSFAASIAELAHGEKSYTQSLSQSPSLFDPLGTAVLAHRNWPVKELQSKVFNVHTSSLQSINDFKNYLIKTDPMITNNQPSRYTISQCITYTFTYNLPACMCNIYLHICNTSDKSSQIEALPTPTSSNICSIAFVFFCPSDAGSFIYRYE